MARTSLLRVKKVRRPTQKFLQSLDILRQSEQAGAGGGGGGMENYWLVRTKQWQLLALNLGAETRNFQSTTKQITKARPTHTFQGDFNPCEDPKLTATARVAARWPPPSPNLAISKSRATFLSLRRAALQQALRWKARTESMRLFKDFCVLWNFLRLVWFHR